MTDTAHAAPRPAPTPAAPTTRPLCCSHAPLPTMPAAAAGEARGVGGGRAEVRFSDARVWLRRARVQFPPPPRRRTTLAARPLSGYSQGAWGGSPIRSERRAGASACAAPRRLAEGGQVPKGEVGVCDGATGGTARALRRVRPEGPHHTSVGGSVARGGRVRSPARGAAPRGRARCACLPERTGDASELGACARVAHARRP